MAARPPVFAKMTFTHTRYAEFKAKLDIASRGALVEAGKVGRAEARAHYTRKFATGPGSTKQSINYRTDSKHILMIYVGTLRGVFKEFGTKMRVKRGQQKAQPFLRPGADAALAAILPAVRKLAPRRSHL